MLRIVFYLRYEFYWGWLFSDFLRIAKSFKSIHWFHFNLRLGCFIRSYKDILQNRDWLLQLWRVQSTVFESVHVNSFGLRLINFIQSIWFLDTKLFHFGDWSLVISNQFGFTDFVNSVRRTYLLFSIPDFVWFSIQELGFDLISFQQLT